ncbi:MAG: TAXI family TRAP transporter solute-binding subunit [Rhodocyclaceae bacterium]|nr:TAXI family TRAP transporter solute-binding subunit [Rhodocyclaceae bacterium]
MTERSHLLHRLLHFVLVACMLHAGLALAADRVRIHATAAQQDMLRDIARHVARDADIELVPRSVAGTPEALLRLHDTGALQLALLQADAAPAYIGATLRGNPDATRMIEPVRAIAPLHLEEIHFLVRSDSPMNHLHDLAGARINLGTLHSGTALSTASLYRLMFGAALPDTQASFLPEDEALVKLITEGSIDAVAVVAPRPARLLANMKPEARNFVKLLRFDPTHATAAALTGLYAPVTAAAADYPNLLEADQPALAVRIFLGASGHGEKRDALLARFAAAWCRNFPRLKAEGPPQWSALELVARPELQGWATSRIAAREIAACMEGVAPLKEPCTQEDRLLGLCQ